MLPDLLELGEGAGQVQPVRHAGQAFLPVEGLDVADLGVDRVVVDRDELDLAGVGGQQLPGLAELLRDQRAVHRARVVQERQQHHLAVQARQRHGPAVLAGEAEGRCREVDRGAGAVDRLRQDGVGDRAGLRDGHRRGAEDDHARSPRPPRQTRCSRPRPTGARPAAGPGPGPAEPVRQRRRCRWPRQVLPLRPARGPGPGIRRRPAARRGSCCWGRCPGRRGTRGPRSAPSPPGTAR